jgi:hypothetical protein
MVRQIVPVFFTEDIPARHERLALRVRLTVTLCHAAIGLFALLPLQAQQVDSPGTISWFMPLEKVADQLMQRYSKPVTYEDPARLSRAEMEVVGAVRGREVLRVQRHTLVMPQDLVDKAPVLSTQVINGILDAYHQQNPRQARFRVIESRMGFHIIPTQVHDDNGRLIVAASPFDTEVSVAVEKRTASEHLAALCAAVTAATGVTIESFNQWFDGYYAANGYTIPRTVTPAQRQYMLFEWGTNGRTAREALIHLMDGSGSSQSWTLHCGQTSGRSDDGCIFQMIPLQVGPGRMVLSYDRCPNCRPIPK